MAARPCKFGYTCRRADCWFSHPEGRQLDGAKPQVPATNMQYLVHAQNFKAQEHQGYYQAAPAAPSQGAAAAAAASQYRSVTRPLTPSQSTAAAGAQVTNNTVALIDKKVCKFGRECHRKDCYFSHPDGREIDDSPHSSSASTPKQFAKKPSAAAREAAASPSDYDLEDDDELDENAVDALVSAKEWFPAYKDCSCCKGYIHDCEAVTCQSLGQCGCSYGKDDASDQPDESWKDEFYGASRSCKCCEGFIYRCKATNPLCSSTGKCFCQSSAAAPAASTASAASAAAAAPQVPGGPTLG